MVKGRPTIDSAAGAGFRDRWRAREPEQSLGKWLRIQFGWMKRARKGRKSIAIVIDPVESTKEAGLRSCATRDASTHPVVGYSSGVEGCVDHDGSAGTPAGDGAGCARAKTRAGITRVGRRSARAPRVWNRRQSHNGQHIRWTVGDSIGAEFFGARLCFTGATRPYSPPSNLQMGKANISLFRRRRTAIRFFVCFALAAIGICLDAEQVRVLEKQGDLHGFLVLKDAKGREIAAGDQTYEARGSVISSRTIFSFRDGSIDDEATLFRQGATFQLVRDHHIQRGPSFPKPMDVTIDAAKGEVSWRDLSKKGNQSKSQQMRLPADLANGMIPLLVENFPHGAGSLTVSYLGASSKPRVVKLTIRPDGSDRVFIGPDGRQAQRFNIHTEIGGVAGIIAPLAGKQPPDIKVWIVSGAVPVFIRMDGPLYEQGPIWTLLLTAPTWPTGEPSGGN
jgi:hypothetical protein